MLSRSKFLKLLLLSPLAMASVIRGRATGSSDGNDSTGSGSHDTDSTPVTPPNPSPIKPPDKIASISRETLQSD